MIVSVTEFLEKYFGLIKKIFCGPQEFFRLIPKPEIFDQTNLSNLKYILETQGSLQYYLLLQDVQKRFSKVIRLVYLCKRLDLITSNKRSNAFNPHLPYK